MTKEFKAPHYVPEHMKGGLERYINHGIPPGSFLRAVLENNLLGAFSKADETNRHAMYEWACVLNTLPLNCWGSEEKVLAYMKSKHVIEPELDDRDIEYAEPTAEEWEAEAKAKRIGDVPEVVSPDELKLFRKYAEDDY